MSFSHRIRCRSFWSAGQTTRKPAARTHLAHHLHHRRQVTTVNNKPSKQPVKWASEREPKDPQNPQVVQRGQRIITTARNKATLSRTEDNNVLNYLCFGGRNSKSTADYNGKSVSKTTTKWKVSGAADADEKWATIKARRVAGGRSSSYRTVGSDNGQKANFTTAAKTHALCPLSTNDRRFFFWCCFFFCCLVC